MSDDKFTRRIKKAEQYVRDCIFLCDEETAIQLALDLAKFTSRRVAIKDIIEARGQPSLELWLEDADNQLLGVVEKIEAL